MSEELKAAQARIAELEGALSWHEEQRNDMAEIRAELAAIKAQEPVAWAGAIEYGVPLLMVEPQNWKATPLYAAPVSVAKAQGVVMPQSPHWPADDSHLSDYDRGHLQGRCDMRSEVIRLNAAHAQQVVPDGSTKMQWPEIVALVNGVLGCEAHKYPCERGSIGHEMTGINFNSLARIIDRVRYLADSPAAPAADALLVEALEKIAAYAPCSGIKDPGLTKMHMGILARDALAAHRAQGVV